jgi:hypothetical protein
MAGLLTHLGLGIIGFLIIYFTFYKAKSKDKIIYGIVFIIANLAPDLIDFGVLSMKTGSLNPDEIMKNPLFNPLALLGHTFPNWIILVLIIISIAWLLYELRKISKKTFVMIIISLILILIGVIIHLRLDKLIIEKNYWI